MRVARVRGMGEFFSENIASQDKESTNASQSEYISA